MTKKQREKPEKEILEFDSGGVFKGLGDLIEKIGQLADKGAELKRSGEFQGTDKEKDVKGIFGFSVKVGLGDDKGVKVEPFGNVHRDTKTGEVEVQEIREPVVDVFDEKDHLLVVAEMPGVGAKDVRLVVAEDLLTIDAAKDDKKYHKEILLPRSYSREKMTVSCNNGIVKIKCVQ